MLNLIIGVAIFIFIYIKNGKKKINSIFYFLIGITILLFSLVSERLFKEIPIGNGVLTEATICELGDEIWTEKEDKDNPIYIR